MFRQFSKANRWAGFALLAIGLLYPVLVYLGLNTLDPVYVVLLVLSFLMMRAMMRDQGNGVLGNSLKPIILVTIALVVGSVMFDPEMAVKIYPISISLGFAAVFSVSLIRPPSIIERFARLQRSDLPPRVQVYARYVTISWILFFIGNALISGWTALYGSREIWTLYNGLISYCLIGLMFTGEYGLRKILKMTPQ